MAQVITSENEIPDNVKAYGLSGLAALDRASVTIVTSDNMSGGGDRKNGEGKHGQTNERGEHIDRRKYVRKFG